MSGNAIEVTGLKKSYGELQAVGGVDLTITEGEVFALLGPNGAGKTTTVEILEGHRRRDAGEVSVLGFDPARGERSFKERIGIVLQETGVERFLTVAEVVELHSGYYPSPLPVDEVLEIVGLSHKSNDKVARLSGGQQRRLDVAVGLAGDPDLLFLDEPTTGFDPQARRGAWDMINNLRSLGKTIFLTTHYMDEAQHLADRVAIIVGGKIVEEGAPQDLMDASAIATMIRFVHTGIHNLPESLAHLATQDGNRVELSTDAPTATLHALTSWALDRGIELEGLIVTRPNLEDVYLSLTDNGVEEA